MIEDEYIKITKSWVAEFVVGLNLCPFAQHPFQQQRIRYVSVPTTDLEMLGQTVVKELDYLVRTTRAEIETSLLIIPNLLHDFLAYLDFVAVAEYLLEERQLEGILQIASFHPNYQFANTALSDVENYTNRSPHPMLHLLREESISWAVDSEIDTDAIPDANIERLKTLGLSEVKKRWNDVTGKN